jgi:hypothetical protein
MKASNSPEPIAVFRHTAGDVVRQGKTDNGRALRHKDEITDPPQRDSQAARTVHRLYANASDTLP